MRHAARLADLAAAAGLILVLLPMLGFVAAVSHRHASVDDGVWRFVRRFRGDQLPHLFGVLRGEFSFFRAARRPLAFAD